jgi:hypothetical protein
MDNAKTASDANEEHFLIQGQTLRPLPAGVAARS